MNFDKIQKIVSIIVVFSLLKTDAMHTIADGFCTIENTQFSIVGFGTSRLQNERCSNALECAMQSGYRIIDTATYYENFEPIGEVLKKYDREKFYIISKVWPTHHTPELIRQDINRTLEQLQLNYIDAYLLHWPNSNVPLEKTLGTLEELRRAHLIRHIGLSNVTVNHLERVFELNVPITWVQVEMHIDFYDAELLKMCHEKSIMVQAWAPLGRGRLVDNALLAELGKKYQKTPAQIALKWIAQHGCIPLVRSENPKHIQENIDIMSFTISAEDMLMLDKKAAAGQRERLLAEEGLGFTDEFDYSYQDCWPKS